MRREWLRQTGQLLSILPMPAAGDLPAGGNLLAALRARGKHHVGRFDASGGGGFSERGPKGYRRSDGHIREDVCERLTGGPVIDPSELDVTVREGKVTLSGFLRRRDGKRRAEELAASVPAPVTFTISCGVLAPSRPSGVASACTHHLATTAFRSGTGRDSKRRGAGSLPTCAATVNEEGL